MNTITKNSLIFTSVLSVVYLFNLFYPANLIYSLASVVVMLSFTGKYIFGLEFKKDSILQGAKFVLIPLLFNVSILAFISYIYFDLARALITILVLPVNYYMFVSLRKVQNLGQRAAIFYRNILITISFATIFLSSALLFRVQMILSPSNWGSFGRFVVVLGVLLTVYFVTYFLTWENGSLDKKYRLYNIVCALITAEVAWVSSIWVINYPVIGLEQKSNLGGTPLPAILITIVYYFLWGIISHKLENSLNRKVLTEYMLISALFIAVLLITANWLPGV